MEQKDLSRRGIRWSDKEQNQLMNELEQNISIIKIAENHKRTVRAINMRLQESSILVQTIIKQKREISNLHKCIESLNKDIKTVGETMNLILGKINTQPDYNIDSFIKIDV